MKLSELKQGYVVIEHSSVPRTVIPPSQGAPGELVFGPSVAKNWNIENIRTEKLNQAARTIINRYEKQYDRIQFKIVAGDYFNYVANVASYNGFEIKSKQTIGTVKGILYGRLQSEYNDEKDTLWGYLIECDPNIKMAKHKETGHRFIVWGFRGNHNGWWLVNAATKAEARVVLSRHTDVRIGKAQTIAQFSHDVGEDPEDAYNEYCSPDSGGHVPWKETEEPGSVWNLEWGS